MNNGTLGMPNLHNLKTKRKINKTASKMTYQDINELSKKVLLEDLQRKWIKRERTKVLEDKPEPEREERSMSFIPLT